MALAEGYLDSRLRGNDGLKSQVTRAVRIMPAQRREAFLERQAEERACRAGARFQLGPGDARRPAAKREGDQVVLLLGEQQGRTAAEAFFDALAVGFDALVVG